MQKVRNKQNPQVLPHTSLEILLKINNILKSSRKIVIDKIVALIQLNNLVENASSIKPQRAAHFKRNLEGVN